MARFPMEIGFAYFKGEPSESRWSHAPCECDHIGREHAWMNLEGIWIGGGCQWGECLCRRYDPAIIQKRLI